MTRVGARSRTHACFQGAPPKGGALVPRIYTWGGWWWITPLFAAPHALILFEWSVEGFGFYSTVGPDSAGKG